LVCGWTASAAEQPAASVLVDAAIGTGYDSNPAQSRDAQGLFFADLALSLAGPLGNAEPGFDWHLNAWYQDYEGPDDIGRVAAKGIWQRALKGGLGALAISTEAALYRDEIIPTDSRNEIALRAQLDRIVLPRLDLMSFAELRWLDYLDPAYPWEGRPGSVPTKAAKTRTQSAMLSEWRGGFQSREDRLANLGLEGRWHLSADTLGAMGIGCAHNASTIRPDGYAECVADLAFSTAPAPQWQFQIDAAWYRTHYDRTRSGFRRRDRGYGIGASLQWSAGASEVLCELRWLENQSDLAIKSFQQTVTRCGFVWHF
jgi:hypothetical protein